MPSGRPVRKSDVWLRRAGEENAVLKRDSGDVYFMNDTAVAIWDLCDGQTETEEMITAVCELSGMHLEIVREDVERILTDFERAGLIQWAGV
jgi:hypothetical protein